jgi:GTPase KRas protein
MSSISGRNEKNNELQMKQIQICILGGSGVGKTAITLQFIKEEFIAEYIPTIEEGFSKAIHFNNEQINLNLIDTSGQADFQNINLKYLKSADAFIFVYSVDQPNSVEDLTEIYQKVVEARNGKPVYCVIAENKSDISQANNKVSTSFVKKKFQHICAQIVNTSAKTGNNIHLLFQKCILMTNSEEIKAKEIDCNCSVQ